MTFRPDPALDMFRNGAARVVRDADVVGHLTTYVWRFRSLRNPIRRQEGVWLQVTWTDGTRSREIDDFGPDWLYVTELRAGALTWGEGTATRERFELDWLSGEERQRARKKFGRADIGEERIDYAFEAHGGELSRSGAATVCTAVLHLLRGNATAAIVDAYTDYSAELPSAAKGAESELRARGVAQGRRDSGMGVELDPRDDAAWALVEHYTPWSINVDLLDAHRKVLGTFHDGSHSIVVRLTPEERILLDASLATIGAFELLADARALAKARRRGGPSPAR